MAVVAASSTAVETSSHSFFSHSHAHGGVLDPNAAWFALASVIIKEWLFRASNVEKHICKKYNLNRIQQQSKWVKLSEVMF